MQATDRFRKLPGVLSDHVFGYLLLANIVPLLQVSKTYSEAIQKVFGRISWIQKRLQQEWWIIHYPASFKNAGNIIRAHLQCSLRVGYCDEIGSCLLNPIHTTVVVQNRIFSACPTGSWLLDQELRVIKDLTSLVNSNSDLENYCVSPDSAYLIVNKKQGLHCVRLADGQLQKPMHSLEGRPCRIGKDRLLLAKPTQEGVTLNQYQWPLTKDLTAIQSATLVGEKTPNMVVPIQQNTIMLGMSHKIWAWNKNGVPAVFTDKIADVFDMVSWPSPEKLAISGYSTIDLDYRVSLWDVTGGSCVRTIASMYDGTISMLVLPDQRLVTYSKFGDNSGIKIHDSRSPDVTSNIRSIWRGVSTTLGFGPYLWVSYVQDPVVGARRGRLVCYDMRKTSSVHSWTLYSALTLSGSLVEGNLIGIMSSQIVRVRLATGQLETTSRGLYDALQTDERKEKKKKIIAFP